MTLGLVYMALALSVGQEVYVRYFNVYYMLTRAVLAAERDPA